MTASALTASINADLAEKKTPKADQRRELGEMSKVMVEQKGLLNVPQAAILLDVSRERVYELIELGKLTPYKFTGRTYLSYTEVHERREQDIKAGRPRRNVMETVVAGVKAAAKTDKTQVKQGGFAGPYEKAKRKR
jgi:excisionase family DNA binding protein